MRVHDYQYEDARSERWSAKYEATLIVQSLDVSRYLVSASGIIN